MRGPPREPTQLKLLRGNPGKQRLNRFEPQPMQGATPPPPPAFMTGYAREEWNRVTIELHRLKLLTVLDLNSLAAYCQVYQRWRIAEEELNALAGREHSGLLVEGRLGLLTINPLTKVADQAAGVMLRYAAEFGLTPAARSRIAVAAADDGSGDGKFDGLLAG